MNIIAMTIVESPVFSTLKKSYGTVTLYGLNGQNIMRERKVDARNPRTLPQQKQRKKFPTLVELSALVSAAAAIGFPNCPQKCSPGNYFVSLNKGAVTVNDDLEAAIDYSKLILSKGCRAVAKQIEVTADAASHMLAFSITEAQGIVSHSNGDDIYYAVIIETDLQEMAMQALGERESLDAPTMNLPDTWDMNSLAIYVFTTSQNGKRASKTVYLEAQVS